MQVRRTFSASRAWRPTVGAGLTRTLGIAKQTLRRSSRISACRRELNSHNAAEPRAATLLVGYSPSMAPTIVRDGQFRLFFFSREETRIHVHVAHPEGEAKFWLTPSVHLAKNVGLSGVQIRQAQAVVEAHIKEIQDAWNRHFGG